uniref:Uncharacterized protein n=1 Tax=Sphaerodactylus townsendi TaxID=933632 RepID=A0ACB8EUR0_9SAUR
MVMGGWFTSHPPHPPKHAAVMEGETDDQGFSGPAHFPSSQGQIDSKKARMKRVPQKTKCWASLKIQDASSLPAFLITACLIWLLTNLPRFPPLKTLPSF